MPLLGELRLQATRENLLPVTYFIHSITSNKQLSNASLQEVELLVDEAITQIIYNAYPGDAHGELLIRVELEPGRDEGDHVILVITLTDWGEPFAIDLIPLPGDITVTRQVAAEPGQP